MSFSAGPFNTDQHCTPTWATSLAAAGRRQRTAKVWTHHGRRVRGAIGMDAQLPATPRAFAACVVYGVRPVYLPIAMGSHR